MDQATLIKERAARSWEEYAGKGGVLRGYPAAQPLYDMLSDLAERIFHLTVIEDDSLSGTNIEGEFNRDSGLVLLRPGLGLDRAVYVIAHEIGHCALDHPLHRIADTFLHINPNVTPDDLSIERQQRITGLDLSDAALTALRGYNQRDIYEMQANAFATELLVPGAFLRSTMQKHPEMRLAELAAILSIPESLVRIGLTQALFGSHPAMTSQANPVTLALDGEQEQAVNCSTPALIVAGPGAGKTRVLVARYARLLEEGIPPRQILALTFANKAAGEMRERLTSLVDEEHQASVEVVTFHAFGLQLLQQYGERIGLKLPLRLITPIDALLLFRRRAARMALGVLDDLNHALENLRKLLEAVARAKEENASPERWAELAQSWAEANPESEPPPWASDGLAFYREYQKTLRRHGLLDYADLQMEALRLFSIPEVAAEIRERYRFVLVDEFQDINFVSGQLVRALDGGRGVVWAVGDPRQSIYGFRGASPVNLSRFRSAEYYPTASVEKLTTNYRSVPDIVAAGMAIPVPSPGAPDLIPPRLHAQRAPANALPAVTAVRLPHGTEEMRWLAAEIRNLREKGIALSDMVVLARKNDRAAEIASALTDADIPHRWGGPIQYRPAFRVLTSVLLLAADDTAGIVGLTTLSPMEGFAPDISLTEPDRRLLLADSRGRWKARRLLKMVLDGGIDGLSEVGQKACRSLYELAMALSTTARPHHNLCVYLFEYSQWLRRLLPEPVQSDISVRAVLATVGQMLDLAATFAAQREGLARSTQSAENGSEEEADYIETETHTCAFLAYLQAAIQSGGLGLSNELDIEGDAVSIITAHRSKGLEWPVVFIPFCMEGEFPSRERDNNLPLPQGLITTDDADATAAHIREEACLFYVAVTRAKDRLFLSSAERYGVRKTGPVAALCQAVIDALKTDNRIDLPEVSMPENAIVREDIDKSHHCLSYPVSQGIHEYDLSLYKECPRKFLFQRIYGLPDGDTAFLAFHSSVYRAARDATQGPPLLRDRFEALWGASGPPADHWQASLFRRAAERLIERMESSIQPGATRLYRQEKTLLIDDDAKSYEIRFTVDEEGSGPDGQRYFRRHKQGSRLPKNTPDEDRVTLYAMLAEQEGPGIDVTFYYPHLNQDMPAPIGKVKKANLRKNMLRMISEIEQGVMPAKPGDDRSCKWCPYALICDRDGID